MRLRYHSALLKERTLLGPEFISRGVKRSRKKEKKKLSQIQQLKFMEKLIFLFLPLPLLRFFVLALLECF